MEFRILGPLEIRQNGRVLACKGAKQRLLLAALLVHRNEVVSSDRLIEALWGEEPPATAPKALQVHVSQLRALLEPDRPAGSAGSLLLTRPPGYELRLEDGQLDLQRFEAGLVEARAASASGDVDRAARTLRAALALWHGEPLADLSFEDFLQAEIGRLEELRLTALEDRIDADLELGRHAALVPELEQLVGGHPLRERLRRQLMLALYRSGRQADALEEYRKARKALVEELGIEPTRELRGLERSILAQDATIDAPRAPRPRSDRAPGLIGREREMEALRPVLDRALTDSARLILVAGEPGIGKSRLAEALAARAEDRGARVAVGRCWEAGGAPPYWPWVQALRSYVRDADPATIRDSAGRAGPELVALLPELGDVVAGLAPPGPLDSPDARFRLFDAVASFLANAAGVQPLAVFLDDLHAADAPSLLLLRFVATGVTDARLLIVGCYRDTDAGPELRETLAELARVPTVERVTLRGLGKDGVAQLLETVIGESPSDELGTRIYDETQGNPLFAGEIARLLASAGDDADVSDGSLPIPDGVREAIRRRLQRQSDACRQVLTLASVLGREFDLATLAQVSGLDDDALFDALEEATSARLIGDVPGSAGRFRFSHILVRDALYEDLPAPRRPRLHLTAGDALETMHAQNLGPHVAELAHHFVEAGDLGTNKATRYAEQAGDAAAAQYGYEEAARYYALALSLAEKLAPDPARSCELLLSLGDAHSRAGNGAAAKDAYRRAAAFADEHGWHDRLVRAALAYGGRFPWARSSTDPALMPLLQRAIEVVGDRDDRARARLLARLAAAIRDDPSRERRVAIAREAVEIARRSGDPRTLANVLEGYGVATEGVDPGAGDLETADELIALGERIGDKERIYTGHDFRLNAFWKLADRAGVDVDIEALTRLADDLRQPAQQWSAANTRTMLALMEGRFEEAEALIEATRVVGERSERWNAGVSSRLQLFVLRRAQGRLAEVEDVIRRSVHEYPTLLRFRCALAHLHVEIGDKRAARSVLDEVEAHDLGSEYLDAEWLFSVSLLPDVHRGLADAAGAKRLYSVLLPRANLYAEAPIEAVFGSIARGLGVLATTMRRFDDAERHFELAIEIERRMRARPWLSHAQHDMAAMLLERGAAGDEEAARKLIDEAVAGYRELGMATWAAGAAELLG